MFHLDPVFARNDNDCLTFMKAEITAIGNEGFRIVTGGRHIFVDAFYHPALWVGAAPALAPESFDRADVILVTHSHADHFNVEQTARVAARTGATVVGPSTVTSTLRSSGPNLKLVSLDPAPLGRGPAHSESASVAGCSIAAFRTHHSRDHNSYRVEADGFSFFHDGDNENTRRLDVQSIRPLDALFIGPWKGAGWPEFIDTIAPKRWFIMHLTEEELDQHETGAFLTDLCDHVPKGLVALRPGQTFVFE